MPRNYSSKVGLIDLIMEKNGVMGGNTIGKTKISEFKGAKGLLSYSFDVGTHYFYQN